MFAKNTHKYIMIAVLLLVAISGCYEPETDDQLSNLLIEHKNQFEQLVALSSSCLESESKILWAHESEGVGAQCSEVMSKIRVRGMSEDSSGAISFYIGDENYGSHQKGLIFSQTRVSPIFDSLDKRPSTIQPYERGYKLLQKNWYIYYEYVN